MQVKDPYMQHYTASYFVDLNVLGKDRHVYNQMILFLQDFEYAVHT